METAQVPSSVNRVYSLIHPDLISVPFTYASGVVLPLMGFWNSVIYITTSWTAVCLLCTGNLQSDSTHTPKFVITRPNLGWRKELGGEADSLKELAWGQTNRYPDNAYSRV